MSRGHVPLPHQTEVAGLPSNDSTKSFWHTEPSPLLLGHHSTRDLPQTADVVVIGSGITGTSVAHHLLLQETSASSDGSRGDRSDVAVVMLEAREACWGATGRNGGHCQPLLFETPHDPSVGHFELANFRTLQSLIQDEGIDCEFVAQPGVRAIYSDHHLEEARTALKIMEQTAPELRQMMRLLTDKEELAKYRIPTASGAVVTDVAARMWPYKFVSHILEHLLTSSDLTGTFNLQTFTPCTAISPYGPECWTVSTPRGNIIARKVVLATNAYTSHLLPGFKDLIVPCRGQMSALEPLPRVQGKDRLKTSLGFLGDGTDDYLIQRPNARGGHLMFGGGRQHGPTIGVTDDSVIDEKTAAYLRTRLVDALSLPEGNRDEEAAEFTAVREWSGIMGFSRDEKPWVGLVPYPQPLADAIDTNDRTHPLFNPSPCVSAPRTGLYMSAGYTGHGMPNTWLCGKATALAVLKSFAPPGDEEAAMDAAAEATGLPASYRISHERIRKAMRLQSVAAQDQAEMERGERSFRRGLFCL